MSDENKKNRINKKAALHWKAAGWDKRLFVYYFPGSSENYEVLWLNDSNCCEVVSTEKFVKNKLMSLSFLKKGFEITPPPRHYRQLNI